MRWVWLWALVPMAVQLVNGCSAPSYGSAQMEVRAEDSEILDGPCFAGATDPSVDCFVVTVRVVSKVSYNLTGISSGFWTAFANDGDQFDQPLVSDDSRLAPHASRTIEVGFTVPNGTRLVRLDWSAGQDLTISQRIPGA